MDLIFLCGLFPKDRENEILANSKNIVHTGPNQLQWSFVSGLKSYFNKFTVITTPLLTNYPKRYKSLYFKGSKFKITHEINGVCLGSIRLPVIGLISKFINVSFFLFRKYNFQKDVQILVYSVHLPYLLSAVFFKLFNKNCKICLFVNDLPQYMSDNKNRFYLYLKTMELSLFNTLQKQVNSYVFVTEQTNELINTSKKPWVLIEGAFDIKSEGNFVIPTPETEKKIILYTGTLDSRYGLKNLLDAFELIAKENYELWICGDGDLKNHLIGRSKNNSKIKYFGMISYSQVMEIQKKATVLVNPRKPIGEYTKYSFPIKTLEYLSSGKPCIKYDLPGLPREYLDFIIIPDNYTDIALKDTIIEICEWLPDRRKEFCNLAINFIENNKSSKAQFEKLCTLLNN